MPTVLESLSHKGFKPKMAPQSSGPSTCLTGISWVQQRALTPYRKQHLSLNLQTLPWLSQATSSHWLGLDFCCLIVLKNFSTYLFGPPDAVAWPPSSVSGILLAFNHPLLPKCACLLSQIHMKSSYLDLILGGLFLLLGTFSTSQGHYLLP